MLSHSLRCAWVCACVRACAPAKQTSCVSWCLAPQVVYGRQGCLGYWTGQRHPNQTLYDPCNPVRTSSFHCLSLSLRCPALPFTVLPPSPPHVGLPGRLPLQCAGALLATHLRSVWPQLSLGPFYPPPPPLRPFASACDDKFVVVVLLLLLLPLLSDQADPGEHNDLRLTEVSVDALPSTLRLCTILLPWAALLCTHRTQPPLSRPKGRSFHWHSNLNYRRTVPRRSRLSSKS